jgi:hypothetical protein
MCTVGRNSQFLCLCSSSLQLATRRFETGKVRGTVVASLMVKQAATVCVFNSSPIKEGRIMSKAISTIGTMIAAVAALTLSGGVYAQAAGGSSGGGTSGSTASPANQTDNSNQMNNSTGGYGTPGITNSESGMGAKAPNSGLPNSTNSNSSSGTSAPKSNNTLATPSVVSPGAGQ